MKTIINLTLITSKLTAVMMRCEVYETEHESDHQVITITFDMVLSL